MDIDRARQFAKYRLFRPLGFEPPFHAAHPTDGQLAKAIAKWTSRILLGGQHYDLGIRPEGVFQVQSNRMNRATYLMPVWDADLVRRIVLETKRKTRRAQRGCGVGSLEDLEYVGGILWLKRVFFRGTPLYRRNHRSESGWFVEDRYHLDVYFRVARRARHSEKEQSTPRKSSETRVAIEPLLRVFHDSVGCLATARWSPGPDVAAHNESVRTHTPEYFPAANELIMSWHELAEQLKEHASGVYALCNWVATEMTLGRHYLAVGSSFLKGTAADGQSTDLSRADDTLWTNPGQAISAALTASYVSFTALRPGGAWQQVNIDSNSRTKLFNSNLSVALVQRFLALANGNAEYLGSGFFRLRAQNALPLVAGTGSWGSAESGPIVITKDGDQGGSNAGGAAGAGSEDNTATGLAQLAVQALRYEQRYEIEQAISDCRQGATAADCEECIDDSVADTYHDWGVAADFVDMVGGIAACVLTAIYGGPVAAAWVCGFSLPAAGAAAEDFWDNTFGDYDYAEDMCSGLPDQSETYTTTGGGGQPAGGSEADKKKDAWVQQCTNNNRVPYVERIQRDEACIDPEATCRTYSRFVDSSKQLIGAVCSRTGDGQDEVICVWCTSGSA